MKKIEWIADVFEERDLRAIGIDATVETHRLSEIDMRESEYNSARLDKPIVRQLVDDYKTAMGNGNPFMRPVVYRGKSKYILASGVQRCTALGELAEENGKSDPEVEVYVLQTADPMLIEAATRSANVNHGGRSSWEERLAHAMHLVRKFGMRPEDARKLFNLAESTINLHLRAEDQRKQLAEAGVNANAISPSSLGEIAKVSDDGLKTKIGALVAQHGTGFERVKQIVGAVRKNKTHSERLNTIKAFERELAVAEAQKPAKKSNGTTHKAPMRPRRDRLMRELKSLADFLDFGLAGQGFSDMTGLQISSEVDRAAIGDLYRRVEFRMKMILKGKQR